jgi:hypothetical protein
MRLHFDFSEYEEDDDGGTRVLLTVNLPDGESHSRVTEIYEKAVSMLYGYDITLSPQMSFNFDDEDLSDDDYAGCTKCVQGTCVMGCGKEFQ